MRRTMTHITVVLFTAFLAGAVAGGTAQADEGDLPEQAWLVCPPFCDPPEDPEPELNCPPICADLFPDDLALDDPCPPDVCGPLPPGDPDEGGQNPPDEPTDEPASDQPDQDDGHRDNSDESAPDAPVSSTMNGAPSGPAVAPIADVAEQPSETSNGSLKAALLAIFAAAGLTAIGVLAFAVSRRR